MKTLEDEINWFLKQRMKPRERREICQCGTEKVIKRSSDPERMQAFLLVGIFIDQFIYTHFQNIYNEFNGSFNLPKLRAHSFAANHPPSWLIYSKRDYDKAANWQLISSLASSAMNELNKWLENNEQDISALNTLVKNEIVTVFEKQHQDLMLKAFGV